MSGCRWFLALTLVFFHASISQALPLIPQNAQTDLYFPHLADGGPASGQWQSRFTFINPNASPATVTLTLYSDSGDPLILNLGNGPSSQTSFSVPANGTVVLQSQIATAATSGWAIAGASLPVQANVSFRYIQNGIAKVEITAEPTLPSGSYLTVATRQVGLALANVYSDPISDLVTVFDGSGQILGQTSITLPAHGHSAFNVSQLFPTLPAGFTGSVLLTPESLGNYLVGWGVYADASGIISSLPDGRGESPRPHPDLIRDVFRRLVYAYQNRLPDFGPEPQLIMSSAKVVNAYVSPDGSSIYINLALAELLNDSPSELASVVGHEMGHIYQLRTGKSIWYSDPEWDADCWGLLMALYAGYDPYASAGALGKFAMATAGLGPQLMTNWEQMTAADAHTSFANRIDKLTGFVQSVCNYSQEWQAYCATYKAGSHPHFPALPSVPLNKPRLPSKTMPDSEMR